MANANIKRKSVYNNANQKDDDMSIPPKALNVAKGVGKAMSLPTFKATKYHRSIKQNIPLKRAGIFVL